MLFKKQSLILSSVLFFGLFFGPNFFANLHFFRLYNEVDDFYDKKCILGFNKKLIEFIRDELPENSIFCTNPLKSYLLSVYVNQYQLCMPRWACGSVLEDKHIINLALENKHPIFNAGPIKLREVVNFLKASKVNYLLLSNGHRERWFRLLSKMSNQTEQEDSASKKLFNVIYNDDKFIIVEFLNS